MGINFVNADLVLKLQPSFGELSRCLSNDAGPSSNRCTSSIVMKSPDLKFAIGQVLLIAGLITLSIGARWSFFSGLALLMAVGLFSFRRDTVQRPRIFQVIWILLCIGGVVFLVWYSSFGALRPPVAALIGVWFGISIDEFSSWRNRLKRA